jgi:hypothetical protein
MMGPDINSLAPGLDGHALRLGIGRKVLRTTKATLEFLFIFIIHCRFSRHCPDEEHHPFAHSLGSLSQTLEYYEPAFIPFITLVSTLDQPCHDISAPLTPLGPLA